MAGTTVSARKSTFLAHFPRLVPGFRLGVVPGESREELAVRAAAPPGTQGNEVSKGEHGAIIGATLAAKLLQPCSGDRSDVAACEQRGGVHESADGFECEAVAQCSLDEAKPVDVLIMVGGFAAAAAPPPCGLQQSAIPVGLHVISAHAHGPSQLGKSERPRSHLQPQTGTRARTGQARYSRFVGDRWKVQTTCTMQKAVLMAATSRRLRQRSPDR
jgi:hypothetical protein